MTASLRASNVDLAFCQVLLRCVCAAALVKEDFVADKVFLVNVPASLLSFQAEAFDRLDPLS
jgi:hypothetical protein